MNRAAARVAMAVSWCLLALGLVTCGGGVGGGATGMPTLSLTLSAGRARLDCGDPACVGGSLVSPAGNAYPVNLACGSGVLLAVDDPPGIWTVTSQSDASTYKVTPTLSAATVFITNQTATIGRVPVYRLSAGDRLDLETTDTAYGVTTTLDVTGTRQVPWTKGVTVSFRLIFNAANGTKLISQPFAPVTLDASQRQTGWSPMVLLNDEKASTVLAWLDARFGTGAVGKLGIGAPWFQYREARDFRVADLNGDGQDDFIASAYGKGCVLLGLSDAMKPATISTPLGTDGVCYGGEVGHGETLLLSDFNNDGLVDAFLPFYERNQLLRNLGSGRFEQVIESGDVLEWPNALAPIEGAAAVDVNFDGWSDIVAGSTVFINNRNWNFQATALEMRRPDRDEGLVVGDFDGDGTYDIAVVDPSGTLAVYWGRASGGYEAPRTVVFGNTEANGVAAGFLTGQSSKDIVVAGGSRAGRGPVICIPDGHRTFTCAQSDLSVPGLGQDLLQIGALSGGQQVGLVARFGYNNGTGEVHFAPVKRSAGRFSYTVEILDAQGRRTLYGRSVRLSCLSSGMPLGAYFIDGGNGFLAQGKYAITVEADCDSLRVEYAGSQGTESYELAPGRTTLRVKS